MLFSSSLLVFLLSTFAAAAPTDSKHPINDPEGTGIPKNFETNSVPLGEAFSWGLSGLTYQRSKLDKEISEKVEPETFSQNIHDQIIFVDEPGGERVIRFFPGDQSRSACTDIKMSELGIVKDEDAENHVKLVGHWRVIEDQRTGKVRQGAVQGLIIFQVKRKKEFKQLMVQKEGA